MPAQQFPVDPGLVVKPVEMRGGRECEEVPIALGVLREKDEVERRGVELGILVRHPAGRDVGFDADDGVQAVDAGLLVELDRPVQRAVVGDRHGGHPQGRGALHERGDPAFNVEQGVFGVQVAVDELSGHSGRSSGQVRLLVQRSWGRLHIALGSPAAFHAVDIHGAHVAQRRRSQGSRTLRTPSPRRFAPRTMRAMAAPGTVPSHQALLR